MENLGYLLDPNEPGAKVVHKYYRQSLNGHFYTTNFNELGYGEKGWFYEGVVFYAY